MHRKSSGSRPTVHKDSDESCCIFHHDSLSDRIHVERVIDHIHRFCEIQELWKVSCASEDYAIQKRPWILLMVLITQGLLKCKECYSWKCDIIFPKWFGNKNVIPLLTEKVGSHCREGVLLKSSVPLDMSDQNWSQKLIKAFSTALQSSSSGHGKRHKEDTPIEILYNLPDNMQFHCFIYSSLSHTDLCEVEILQSYLQENGVSCVSVRDYLPGQSYNQNLFNFVQNSEKVFIVLSAEFQDNKYSSRELKNCILPFCLAHEDKVIPVVVDESELPDVLKAIEPISTCDRFWKQKLLTAVGDVTKVMHHSKTGDIKGKDKGVWNYNLWNVILLPLQFVLHNSLLHFWSIFKQSILRPLKWLWQSILRSLAWVKKTVFSCCNSLKRIVENLYEQSREKVQDLLDYLRPQPPEVDTVRLEGLLGELEQLQGGNTRYYSAMIHADSAQLDVFPTYVSDIAAVWDGYNPRRTKSKGSMSDPIPNREEEDGICFIYAKYHRGTDQLIWIPVTTNGMCSLKIRSFIMSSSLYFQVNVEHQVREATPRFVDPRRISDLIENSIAHKRHCYYILEPLSPIATRLS